MKYSNSKFLWEYIGVPKLSGHDTTFTKEMLSLLEKPHVSSINRYSSTEGPGQERRQNVMIFQHHAKQHHWGRIQQWESKFSLVSESALMMPAGMLR